MIQAVLEADVERERLLAEERKILGSGDEVFPVYLTIFNDSGINFVI